jgi:hypothetical protein
MNLPKRILRVVTRDGIAGLGYRAYAVLADFWFDFRYDAHTRSTVTLDRLSISGNNRTHGNRYEPARVAPLRMLFQEIRQLLPTDQKLVDLGSGKGRVLLVAAESGFARATGVEFAAELCEQARTNCLSYIRKTGATTELVVVESDVTSYNIRPDDNVFFLFNPFDETVLYRVLDNILVSHRNHPRPLLVCFYNTPASALVLERPEFRKVLDKKCRGYQFDIFTLQT